MASVTSHTACRTCGAESLVPYLDLGIQAPANALLKPADIGQPEFTAPLSVSWCSACGLSQLDHVVDPKILYTNYPFRAGTSQKWREHCAALVASCTEKLVSRPGQPFLIDVGSNDGVLLEAAQGWKVLGVDPGGVRTNVSTVRAFWNTGVAKQVVQRHGQADVITATNVFGHVDDAKDFLSGIAIALKPSGRAIIECPHIIPLLDDTAFDTIYHEHLTYWSLRPLEMLAESVGLKVVDVKLFPDLHGGTMRYVLSPGDLNTKVKSSVTGLRILESALFKQGIGPYQEFAERARGRIDAFRTQLVQERRQGSRIWAYGASAKGNVLLQAACLSETTVERVVDDCEAKWGFLTPGTHIPITNANELSEPNILVLLSWNNAADLKRKARQRGFRGAFILPNEPQLERAA